MPSAPGGTPPGGMGAGMGGTPWGGAGGGTGPPTGKDERTAHVQEKDYFSLTSQFVNLKRFNPKGFEKKMMCARASLVLQGTRDAPSADDGHKLRQVDSGRSLPSRASRPLKPPQKQEREKQKPRHPPHSPPLAASADKTFFFFPNCALAEPPPDGAMLLTASMCLGCVSASLVCRGEFPLSASCVSLSRVGVV